MLGSYAGLIRLLYALTCIQLAKQDYVGVAERGNS